MAVFKTVSDDLIKCAECVVEYYRGRSYRVSIENSVLGYPSLPTLTAKRDRGTVIVEIGRKVIVEKLDAWVSYGRSCNKEIRIVFATDVQPSKSDHTYLSRQGIGLLVLDKDEVILTLDSRDLSVSIQLPALKSFPMRLRNKLAPIYDKKDRGLWKEVFEDSCKLLEGEAARYLIAYSVSGRIKIMRRQSQIVLAKRGIERLTMGQLADTFKVIVSPNKLDSQIEAALRRVNGDRVNITHRSRRPSTEDKLRRNVGQHLWVIIDILKQIDDAL